MPNSPLSKVRLDKWLWAARFYKTRSIAKQAIDGGKVHVDGQRAKPSREIEAGALITLRQGWDEKEVHVLGLSEQRGPASIATELYEETATSVERREKHAAERKAIGASLMHPASKPTSRQRRHIHRFKRIDHNED